MDERLGHQRKANLKFKFKTMEDFSRIACGNSNVRGTNVCSSCLVAGTRPELCIVYVHGLSSFLGWLQSTSFSCQKKVNLLRPQIPQGASSFFSV